MATVIYLPKGYGGTSPGEALGGFAGQAVGGKLAGDAKKKRAEMMAELFESIQTGDNKGAKEAVASGAISEPDDLINLVSALRNQRKGSTIKVPAWSTENQKETSFALDKNDLATGHGEDLANKLGLTLFKPKDQDGSVRDYYADAPNLKFLGIGGKKKRPNGGITLDEWKTKYGSKRGKATDKDKTIDDYLKAADLENTATNRHNVRQYLSGADKATEIVNARFGSKTGKDWTFDSPAKAQAAAAAKSLIERFIVHGGYSPEQAGQEAIRAGEAIAQKIEDDQAKAYQQQEGGESSENTAGKIVEDIKDAATATKNALSGQSGSGDNEDQNKGQKKEQGEGIESEELLGKINGVEVYIPPEMTDAAEVRDHIVKKYNIPEADVTAWLISNQPTE